MSIRTTSEADTKLSLAHPIEWRVEFVDSIPPAVRLSALTPPASVPSTSTALKVASATALLEMDARVAMALYKALGSLGCSMGWLPQLEDSRQS
jgi:hypothetical protein